MEKLIEEQLEGHKAGEVFELNLDSCAASLVTGLTEEFVNLETLTLTNNNLKSLKGLPKLPNLRKLDLSDNQLEDGLESLQQTCPNLKYLILSGNLFSESANLAPLKELKFLQSLELYNCPVTEIENYRTKLMDLLPDVIYIDSFDRFGQPAPNDDYDEDEDDDEGDDVEGEYGGSEDEDDVGSDFGEAGNDDPDEDDDGSDEDNQGGDARGTKRKHEGDEEDDA